MSDPSDDFEADIAVAFEVELIGEDIARTFNEWQETELQPRVAVLVDLGYDFAETVDNMASYLERALADWRARAAAAVRDS